MVSEKGAEIKRRRLGWLSFLLAQQESRDVVAEANHLFVIAGFIVPVTPRFAAARFLGRKFRDVARARCPLAGIRTFPIPSAACTGLLAVASR